MIVISDNKLRKTVVNNGVTQYTKDYINGIEYKNGALEAIYHSEGRVTTIDGTLKYEYAMKDHLGNTRLMFCDRNGDGVIKPEKAPEPSEVTQENSYYAFGMNMEFGAWENTPSVTDNLKQYNGKELNTDFGLNWNDYGARFYDPATARWNVIDPKSEKYYALNPYNYASNNPAKFIDPNGMDIVRPEGENDEEKQKSLTMIKNTLTKEDAEFVKLDSDGNIDSKLLNSHKSESGNYNSLVELVKSEITVEVSLNDNYNYVDKDGQPGNSKMDHYPPDPDSDKDTKGTTLSGTSTGETGFLGKTLFPDRKGLQNSPDTHLKVIVNKDLSPAAQAEIYSHEGNGHALIYVTSGGNREQASHTVIGMKEQNQILIKKILDSKSETIKNMNQH